MGIAAAAAAATAAATMASTASDMFNSDSPTAQYTGQGAGSQAYAVPPTYQPRAQGQFDDYYQGAVGGQYPLVQQANAFAPRYLDVQPTLFTQYMNNLGAIQNNPWQNQGVEGALQAADWAQGVGGNQYRTGIELMNAAGRALPYYDQILQTGFDPQGALRDRMRNEMDQRNAAILASTGTGSTPYGAGLLMKAGSDFDMDWQDRQLGRAATAGNSAMGLLRGIGSGYDQAGQLGERGMRTVAAGSLLPYQTSMGMYNDQYAALDAAMRGLQSTSQLPTWAMAPSASFLTGLQPYLQLGQTAAANAGRNAYYGSGIADSAFNRQRAMGEGMGSALDKLGTAADKWFAPSDGSMSGWSMPVSGVGTI